MLSREIIAVCSMIRTKLINTLCGRNVQILNIELSGKQSNKWASKVKSLGTSYLHDSSFFSSFSSV